MRGDTPDTKWRCFTELVLSWAAWREQGYYGRGRSDQYLDVEHNKAGRHETHGEDHTDRMQQTFANLSPDNIK